MLVKKKCWSILNKIWSKNLFGRNFFFGQQNLGRKTFWVKKNWVTKIWVNFFLHQSSSWVKIGGPGWSGTGLKVTGGGGGLQYP